jgi:tRNA (guanine37-N1)-methyltransferase
MVMKPQPWGAALDAVAPADGPPPRLLVPTPGGRLFTQESAAALAAEPWLVFACGRYEGIDARVLEDAGRRMPVDELSIGDYVLAGGEVAVLVVVEAVGRLLPGVVANTASVVDDSFAPGAMAGLLEAPAYTRPATWRGLDVPAVLRSGDHGAVSRWRRTEALRRTAARRPDLLRRLDPARLDLHDHAVLRAALGDVRFAELQRGWAGNDRAGRPFRQDVAE